MTRILPTKGSAAFFRRYLDTFIAKMSSNLPSENSDRVLEHLRNMQRIIGDLSSLEQLGMITEAPAKSVLENDASQHMALENGWENLVAEDFVDNFGRNGNDAISCLGEAVLYTNALAIPFDAKKVFYRGEHNYGWPPISRAERHMDMSIDYPPGITDREISEIERFQEQVRADKDLAEEIFAGKIPNDEHPSWLPVMQHYDGEFGSRLLDLTSSVFTGLYFACVGWDGEIDEEIDGLLYVFFDSSSQWRGEYFEVDSGQVSEFDDIAPDKLADSFKEWSHPEYFRLYRSSSANPRELAQDGVFLVKGAIGSDTNYGQNFKFRIPAGHKKRILKELWFAGYTPARIVRGHIGLEAEAKLAEQLGFSRTIV